jgi:hypothetical protein
MSVGKKDHAIAADRGRMFASEHSDFGRYLVASGKLAEAALERAERARADESERLEVVLTRLGLISERDLAQALAGFLDLSIAAPNEFPDAPILEDRLGRKFLRERHLIPIEDRADGIVIAMAYPLDAYATDAVRFAVGKPVLRKIAIPSDLDAAFERLYGDGKSAIRQIVDNTKDRASETRDDDVDRLREENPGVRTIARPRSFDGDRNAFRPRGVAERSDILYPGLLVEIGGNEPARFVQQHRIHADCEIRRLTGCLSRKMRTENIIPDGDKCLVRAFSAFHLRLSAHASDPLISACGCVSRLPRFGVFPPAGKHILSPVEKASEQCNLIGSRRHRGHAGDGFRRGAGRFNRPRALQHAQLLGDLRPFPIECGQPALQGCDLSDNVTRTCDRIVSFSSTNLAIPSSRSSHYILQGIASDQPHVANHTVRAPLDPFVTGPAQRGCSLRCAGRLSRPRE